MTITTIALIVALVVVLIAGGGGAAAAIKKNKQVAKGNNNTQTGVEINQGNSDLILLDLIKEMKAVVEENTKETKKLRNFLNAEARKRKHNTTRIEVLEELHKKED